MEELTRSEEGGSKGGSPGGAAFVLEFDAARKIAQGLGAKLEELGARRRQSRARRRGCWTSRNERSTSSGRWKACPGGAKKVAKKKQMALFAELEEAAETQGWGRSRRAEGGHHDARSRPPGDAAVRLGPR
jgi:putative DNA methylase